MAQEFLLSTNEYNEPKVFSGKDAIAYKLLLLLNMSPGSNPLHPEMGVDLVHRYRYCSEDDLDDLKEEILTQVRVYLPTFETMIDCRLQFTEDRLIETFLYIDDTVFQFQTNENETVLRLGDVGINSGQEVPDRPNNEDEDPNIFLDYDNPAVNTYGTYEQFTMSENIFDRSQEMFNSST